MIPDYGDVMGRGRRRRAEYAGFLKTLAGRRKAPLERLFREAHDAAFSEIDCLRCGRCCTGLGPRLTDADAARIAARERLKTSVFIRERLMVDEDGDMVFASMPCRYFGPDGYCHIYEDRPAACRDYPHLDRGRQKARTALHTQNLEHCPAVILAVEHLMESGVG